MKQFKLGLIAVGLVMFTLSACKQSILEKKPVDRYTDAVLWSDIKLVRSYVYNLYEGARIGFQQYMITSVSDESQAQSDNLYVRGDMAPEGTNPWGTPLPGWNQHYQNIQRINKLLDNINRLLEGTPAPDVKPQVDLMTGEALFLRAWAYSQLARTYGGVPLMKEESGIKQDFQSIPRASFEETINFIVKDCDDAISLLNPKATTVMGLATKETAMALKSRILLFAASDLTADKTAASKYVGYENPNRVALWTAARDAAKAIIDLNTYALEDFGAPNKATVAQKLYDFYRAKTLASKEVIWGKMYSSLDGVLNKMNQWHEPSGRAGWNTINPTQKFIDSYQMDDGSNFSSHFQVDAAGYYTNISGKFVNANMYQNRDPRFYGSILYDQAVWKANPYRIRDSITIRNGVQVKKVFGYDTRNSDYNAFNATQTGYGIRKMLDEATVNTSVGYNNDNAWFEFRYAEILLNYAEASIALNQIADATTYINMIRSRAAMPDFTGDITQALRYERMIELSFENHRWYDLRRWKLLLDEVKDSYGIGITQTDTDGVITTTYKRNLTQKRALVQRNYWIPISSVERAKAPQLEQNPGY
jgi:starch-binding outer membrane protein, SusD/RagB family